MSITRIDQEVESLPQPPTMGDPNSFDERADTFLSKLVTFSSQVASFITKLNLFREEANQLGSEIESTKVTVESMKDEVISNKTIATNSAATALNKAEEARSSATSAANSATLAVEKAQEASISASEVSSAIEHMNNSDVHVSILNKSNWDSKAEGNHNHDALYLGKSSKAVDSDKLNGRLSADYQLKLLSGTTIKTVNGNSILGSGDIAISSSSGGANGILVIAQRYGQTIETGFIQATSFKKVTLHSSGLTRNNSHYINYGHLGTGSYKVIGSQKSGGAYMLPSGSSSTSFSNPSTLTVANAIEELSYLHISLGSLSGATGHIGIRVDDKSSNIYIPASMSSLRPTNRIGISHVNSQNTTTIIMMLV